MMEKRIVEQCAPTLAGIKCGSLFRTNSDIQNLASEIDHLNGLLNPRGVIVTAFRPSGCGTLIYVYRAKMLDDLFADGRMLIFLKEKGYDTSSVDTLVASLREKVEERGCVPHEIGLFLGYPLEDVMGFIENRGQCPKCIGCWKVYGDEEKATALFGKFRKCRSVYGKCYEAGTPITKLTVLA